MLWLSRIWPLKPLQANSCDVFFNMFPSFFEHFCAFWLILCFLCPSLGVGHFSVELGSFLWRHVEISIWALSVLITGRVLSLLTLLADRGMFTYLCYLIIYLYTHLCLLPYIYLSTAVQYLSLPYFHFYKSLYNREKPGSRYLQCTYLLAQSPCRWAASWRCHHASRPPFPPSSPQPLAMPFPPCPSNLLSPQPPPWEGKGKERRKTRGNNFAFYKHFSKPKKIHIWSQTRPLVFLIKFSVSL